MMVCTFKFLVQYIFIKANIIAIMVVFRGSTRWPINEGNTGPVEVAYLGIITQSFMVTIESYQCGGSNVATRMYFVIK